MSAPPPSDQPPRQPRGCLPTLAVLLLMVGIVGGGLVTAAAVAGIPAQPVAVAEGVIVAPLPDWQFAGRSEDGRQVLVTKGSGSLAVEVRAVEQTPEAALRSLLDEWAADPGTRIAVGPIEPVDIRPGQSAVRATYAGSFTGIAYPIEGAVTAVRGRSVVLFDGWAGEGEYVLVRNEIDRMIREATVP